MHYVGIDIGKRHHVAVILDTNGQQVGKALRFANDRDGFDQLLVRLAELEPDALIGLEATGHYWLALYTLLAEAGYDLVVLNALQIHAYARAVFANARMTGMMRTGLPTTSGLVDSRIIRANNLSYCSCAS